MANHGGEGRNDGRKDEGSRSRVAKEGNVELAELAGAVDGFKASMDEQDAQFEQQEAELRSRPEGAATGSGGRVDADANEGWRLKNNGFSWEDGQRDRVVVIRFTREKERVESSFRIHLQASRESLLLCKNHQSMRYSSTRTR